MRSIAGFETVRRPPADARSARALPVTGAAGFLGSNLIGMLEQDERVRRIVAIDVKAAPDERRQDDPLLRGRPDRSHCRGAAGRDPRRRARRHRGPPGLPRVAHARHRLGARAGERRDDARHGRSPSTHRSASSCSGRTRGSTEHARPTPTSFPRSIRCVRRRASPSSPTRWRPKSRPASWPNGRAGDGGHDPADRPDPRAHRAQRVHPLPRPPARSHDDGLRPARSVPARGRRHRRASHLAVVPRRVPARSTSSPTASCPCPTAIKLAGRIAMPIPHPIAEIARPGSGGWRSSAKRRRRSSSTCVSSAWPTGARPRDGMGFRPAYTSREAVLDFVPARSAFATSSCSRRRTA